MVFINTSETIGIVLGRATEVTTGSMFVSLLIIVLVIMALALMFGIQLEFTAILILPLILSCMAYYSEFIATGSIIFIYLALIISKKFIIR